MSSASANQPRAGVCVRRLTFHAQNTATGTAEPGGWTSRELLTILDGLAGLSVVGADVVEVAPVYDNPGETTVLAAAEVGLSLLTLMVDNPVKSKADT